MIRGGASLASNATDVAFLSDGADDILRGGSSSSPLITQQHLSVLMMACAMSLHFFGYEFARSATLTLFTSAKSGFASNAALPLVLACVCPASLALLQFYTKFLESHGPRGALRVCAIGCAATLGFFALAIETMTQGSEAGGAGGGPGPALKMTVAGLFVFREAYVQLLATQHWSFMGSVLDSRSGSRWFGPIAGATSASSAIAGYAIGPLVRRMGVCGLLGLTSASLVASGALAEAAYGVAERGGFSPADEHESESKKRGTKKGEENIFSKAGSLFSRVPALKFLFFETLVCQGLSTVLNVTFIATLRKHFPSDKDRASFMGMFYALANLASGVFQFGVIPHVMHLLRPSWVWLSMPSVMVAMCMYQLATQDPGLMLVAGAFMTMKTLEYSIRGVANELIYVPLDFESRYVGKEVIGMLGYR